MPEQQNIEYKQSWHDDYLKWVCGFANAQGGAIVIGKDDNGKVVGISDYKKLMDEIPNKAKDLMGILLDINLHEEKGLYYLEIITQPYAVPISLRGRYYYRSGSTKQELIGAALTDYLLRKSGKTWDEVAEPTATLDDIDDASLKSYIAASLHAGRISDVEGLSKADLIAKLRLTDDNGNIKRAAIVLFGKNPAKFFNNCVVKIGRFGKDSSDLRFQETVEGNIVYLLKEVLEQLNRKFLTRAISFEGIQRIEKGEYPIAALREMLLNALVHRNYLGSSVVQMRMFDNHFNIWNEGELPAGISLDSLKRQHPSRPRNLLIADVCFKGGYIDAWRSGTLKIISTCKEAGLPDPEIIEQDGGILVTLFKNKYSKYQLQILGLNERQVKAILYVVEHGSITNSKYQEINAVAKTLATEELKDLIGKELIKQTGSKGRGSKYELKE
ncbi:MAG: transcriptional regulator [Hydrotalea flava]|uniref:ATP-binding protein n=1 Tax=Hydrotalea TaxID=1004300 RepID=UPI000944FCFF|nr:MULTISPECIES: ATP-binding protein [Hydrotalea]NIM36156.1 transcriptional regulator [Hydrotalea flava]NIM39003.1 transcriptional regulator [Hydrotalea flava]NIN04192.1 transcriptional regulator [Hydrotalea flava]NIN15865.1 transcriptional regulator [Hydrotalea flava]NIO94929.1 transcriptional regulator [Hydrotalea flava]